MPSGFFVLIDSSSELSSADDSSIESKTDLSSTKFHLFYNNSSSSNGAKVIMSPVFPWDDIAYEIYKTAGSIAIAYEYVCDVYANALEFSPQIQCHVKKPYLV